MMKTQLRRRKAFFSVFFKPTRTFLTALALLWSLQTFPQALAAPASGYRVHDDGRSRSWGPTGLRRYFDPFDACMVQKSPEEGLAVYYDCTAGGWLLSCHNDGRYVGRAGPHVSARGRSVYTCLCVCKKGYGGTRCQDEIGYGYFN